MGSVGKLQEIYKKFGNLLPNEMQNKIVESYDKNLKNLDKMKQLTNQTDDYLKPHNDMEGQNDLLMDNDFCGQKRTGTDSEKLNIRICCISYARFRIRKQTILIISNRNASERSVRQSLFTSPNSFCLLDGLDRPWTPSFPINH